MKRLKIPSFFYETSADTIQLLVSRPVTTKQWLICAFPGETAARYQACVRLRGSDPRS